MLRFASRLPIVGSRSAVAEAQRVDLVLAVTRTVLAACSLVAVYVDPTVPLRYSRLVDVAVVGYFAYSLITLLLLRTGKLLPTPRVQVATQVIDLIGAAGMTVLSQGPSSPFFVFYIFLLIEAAYRWGLRGALLMTAVAMGAHLGEALVLRLLPGIEGNFEINRFIVRFGYLGIVGVLAGYIAESEKRHRARIVIAAALAQKAQSGGTLRAALRAVQAELLRAFAARTALLLVEESSNGAVFLWRSSRESTAIECQELGGQEREMYFRTGTTGPWYGLRKELLDSGILGPTPSLPDFLQREEFHAVAMIPIAFKNEWNARLFLLDPAFGKKDTDILNYLAEVVAQTAPSIRSGHLFRRLRSRIGVMERARLARELHDGVIQSLIAAEMDLEVLRRRSNAGTVSDTDFLRIQDILRSEVRQLRSLMHQLRPVEINSRDLVGFLTELTERFRSETGINAKLLCDEQNPMLPPAIAREVAQIAKEALVNVRKHAAARSVLVRFGSENGCWKLVIHDDGKGLGFTGRGVAGNLGAAGAVPRIIKERVDRAHGELILESGTGVGARLEITIPKAFHS